MINSINPKPTFRALTSFRRVLRPAAFATVAGVLLAVESPASAAECNNGYRIIGDNVLVRCDEPSGSVVPDASPPQARLPLSEPLTTGSISSRRSAVLVVDPKDCRPGLFHMMEWGTNGGSVLLAC